MSTHLDFAVLTIYRSSYFSCKIVEEQGAAVFNWALFLGVGPRRHHELVYYCVLNRGWGEFCAIVADVLPLLEGIAAMDHPLLEGFVGLLELPQMLLLLPLAHQRSISLMFTLLMINRLKVTILRTPLLHIKLLLEL